MRAVTRTAADRGSLSVYFVVLVVPFLLIAGLVVDGSGALVARQRATDEAEQAARAGANQLDLAELRASGKRTIDDAAAQAAVDSYLSGGKTTSHSTQVQHAPGEKVTVTVTVTYAPIVLTGIKTTYQATASAVPLSK
jgi:Flp pilus assembly protein TadG